MKKNNSNLLVAAAVASLFACGPAFAAEKAPRAKDSTKTVKCGGVNECKGKGACSGADNACKSHNECKGKGWVETKSAKDCSDKGGKVQS